MYFLYFIFRSFNKCHDDKIQRRHPRRNQCWMTSPERKFELWPENWKLTSMRAPWDSSPLCTETRPPWSQPQRHHNRHQVRRRSRRNPCTWRRPPAVQDMNSQFSQSIIPLLLCSPRERISRACRFRRDLSLTMLLFILSVSLLCSRSAIAATKDTPPDDMMNLFFREAREENDQQKNSRLGFLESIALRPVISLVTQAIPSDGPLTLGLLPWVLVAPRRPRQVGHVLPQTPHQEQQVPFV